MTHDVIRHLLDDYVTGDLVIQTGGPRRVDDRAKQFILFEKNWLAGHTEMTMPNDVSLTFLGLSRISPIVPAVTSKSATRPSTAMISVPPLFPRGRPSRLECRPR